MQVFFLPWADIHHPIKLGRVTFWSYYDDADNNITDALIRNYLDNYFQSYIDNEGKKIKTITICSQGNIDFRNLNNLETDDIVNAVNVLAFVGIAAQTQRSVIGNNRSWAPPCSDVYELLEQKFELGLDDISFKVGNTIHGGMKIGEFQFSRPWTAIGENWYKGEDYKAEVGRNNSKEKKLLESFDKCFSIEIVDNRLFRSIEWFRLSHGGTVSTLSRIVMMMTAFEILSDISQERFSKSERFVKWVDDKIATKDLKKDIRKTKNKDLTFSLGGCWAWDFYKLRNEIVHGDTIPIDKLVYKGWFTYAIVADCIFFECVSRILCDQNYYGQSTKDFVKQNIFNEDDQNKFISYFLGFNAVHKALGWIS